MRRSAPSACVSGARGVGQPSSAGGAGRGPRSLAAEAVAVAFEAEDVGVVDEPVDHRGGDHVVAEDLAPLAENGLLLGDDHRGLLVAAGDELEHQVRGLGVERDVADLVNDDQRDQREAFDLCLEVALAFGLSEPGDPLGRGRELDALPGEARADAERDAEVGLAGARAGRAGSRSAAVEEVELAEVLDHLSSSRERWKVKSNSSSVLRAGNRAVLIRFSPPWTVAGGHLACRAAPRGTAHSSRTPPGPAPPAPGTPSRPRAPSARGTGAPARSSRRSCDQRVIDRQGALLNNDVVASAAALALDLQLVLVGGVDDRLMPGEHPLVAGGELAGVQHRRDDLRLARHGPRRAGRRTAGRSSSRCGRPGPAAAAGTLTTQRRSVSTLTSPERATARARAASRSAGTAADRAVLTTVRLLGPAVELVLEVQVVREGPARLEVLLQIVVLALELPLRLRITGVEDDPADLQLPAERQERLASASRDRRSRTPGPRPASPAAPPAAAGCAPGRRGCPAPPC